MYNYVVMNIVTNTTLRNNLADAMDTVSNTTDYLLVSNRGKITSALVNIDLFEDLLALGDKKYLKSIQQARDEYKNGDILSHKDVWGET